MIQGTTPTFVCTLPQNSTVDLTEAEHVYFTLSQGSAVIDKSDTNLTILAKSVEATLTQAESLRFSFYSDAKIQLNWTYSDGSRGCTKIKTINVGENLHKAVIS